MRKYTDHNYLSGQMFGRLEFIEDLGIFIKKGTKNPVHYAKCICSCSEHKERIVSISSLLSGNTKSCGCVGKENRLKANTKHGLSHSRIKRIYHNMHSRCENPNTPKFKNHGGRGIYICKEWSGENGFMNFVSWAMENGYSEDLTLDRIDNDGNYEPYNCRWADIDTQHENRSVTRYFEINGASKMAKDWCKEYEVNINTFWQRYLKGLRGEDLISAPSNRTKRNKSEIVGVYKRSDTGKWYARIQVEGINFSLGNYEHFEDATKARLNGELKYLGKYTDNYEKAIELKIISN